MSRKVGASNIDITCRVHHLSAAGGQVHGQCLSEAREGMWVGGRPPQEGSIGEDQGVNGRSVAGPHLAAQ